MKNQGTLITNEPRKALGATYRNILTQFLVESVAISVTGGILGIILGIGASYIISLIAKWDTVVSMPAIGGAFCVTVLIGIFFGIYPARKAALLDPIEALRYE
jgi:putative ABC transport system permease protein